MPENGILVCTKFTKSGFKILEEVKKIYMLTFFKIRCIIKKNNYIWGFSDVQ